MRRSRRCCKRSHGLDEVIAIGEAVPAEGWDYWAPVLSLPGLCGTTLETIPAATAYLRAQPQAVQDWADRLPPSQAARGSGLERQCAI